MQTEKNKKNIKDDDVTKGPLYHELDMLEIPMFSFESKKNSKDLTQEYNLSPAYVEGKEIKRKVVIAATEKFGFPGAFSFEVYNCLLYLGCLNMKIGNDFPKKLEFNISDIADILRINKSGDTYQRIKQSIMQIKATNINFEGKMLFENKTKKYSNKIFSIFDVAAFYGDRDEEGSTVDKSYVIFNDIIVNNMNAKYNMYVEYENYQKLDTSIARALYLRLYKPLWAMDKKNSNCYWKEYNKLCEWLLLKPQEYMSYIKRQLEKHLKELVKNNVISAYDIRKSKNNKTYIIYFYRVMQDEDGETEVSVSPAVKIQKNQEKLREQYNKEVTDFISELENADIEAYKNLYEKAKDEVRKSGLFKEDSLLFEAHIRNIILEMYRFPNFNEWCEKGHYKAVI